MKLIDWMLKPDRVRVARAGHRSYATDRYVVVDCLHVDDRKVPEPGHYSLSRNRAPKAVACGELHTSDPVKLLREEAERFERDPGPYSKVTWSPWANNSTPGYAYRVGGLAGRPVATWDKIVSAVPGDIGFVGRDPRAPLLIGRRLQHGWTFIGLITTARMDPDAVPAAIVDAL